MQQEIGSGTEYLGSRNSTNSSHAAGPFGVVRSAALFPCSLNCFPLLWFLERKPSGTVIEKYEAQHPRLLALAETLSGDARFTELKAHPLDVALNQLWADLAAIDTE